VTLVVDASALVLATTEATRDASALRTRLARDVCHAPHLIDAEVGNVLRRKALRGELHPDLGATVLRHAPALIDHRHDHRGVLAEAAWSLRDNLTFYDALYVALASALSATLVTADARLAASPGRPRLVEVVPPSR
jgi:predicted nucleic acid-binding protein